MHHAAGSDFGNVHERWSVVAVKERGILLSESFVVPDGRPELASVGDAERPEVADVTMGAGRGLRLPARATSRDCRDDRAIGPTDAP